VLSDFKKWSEMQKKNYVVGGRKEHTSSPAGPQNPLLCTPLLPHLQHQEIYNQLIE